MDNFKKIASLEELEALKDLIHYENSGEHKPVDKREKILVDFTKPVGKIKSICKTPLCKANISTIFVNNSDIKDYSEAVCEIIENNPGKSSGYFEISAKDSTESIPCRKFFEIFAETSLQLKKKFPEIKLGAGGFDNCLSDYVHEFLNYLSTDKRISPDFFSWHGSFAKAEQLQNYVYASRTLLDKYGFKKTENAVTFWNYAKKCDNLPEKEFFAKQASFTAACLISLQKTPADFAVCDKELPVSSVCAMAFKAFAALSELGIEVTSDTAADHVYVVGAKDDDKGAFMLANFNPYEKVDHELVFDLKGVYGKKCEIYLLDAEHDLELVYEGEIPETYNLKSETVVLVKLI